MAITIRQATVEDVQAMQNTNIHNLPENYTFKYYLYHLLSWPQLSFVATTYDDIVEEGDETADPKNNLNYTRKTEKVVGYVLGKMDDDPESLKTNPPNGHITSLSVMRTYRKLGIAEKLMRQCLYSLCENYQLQFVSLHVRESNRAALHLYKTTLDFKVLSIENSYYQDGEDAYYMKKTLVLDELVPGKFQSGGPEDDLESDLI